MSTTNRAALLTKIHKVLKKHGKAHVAKGEQPLLETMLLAACLEDAHHDTAESVLLNIRSTFFDWNEVRVSTVKELSEVMEPLPDPAAAATRLKGILQSVFESDYSFDLEQLKKQNIGQAVKRLQKLEGATPFVVAYATQVALGGHSIPVDKGTLDVLIVLGVINAAEAKTHTVPGMERAIPKSKGQEFGGLLHELGADFTINPFAPALRELILSIAPDAKERLPKRGAKKPPEPVVEAKGKAAGKGAKAPVGKTLADKADKSHAKQAAPAAAKKATEAKKPAEPAHKGAAANKKKPEVKKKTPTKQLAKRKPR
jgi:endonuclease-3